MTKKTKIIIFSVLIIQTLIIISILSYIRNKRGDVIISPLKKESLIFPKSFPKLINFYEPKPNSIRTDHPDWLPYTATNTINNDGLNERFDYSIKKDPDVYRIIVLGDSFTFGLYVNTPDNWTEKLEDLFQTTSFCKGNKQVEVINLGVGGYDIEYSVARLKLRGIKYDPDMVIWLIKDDDFKQINEIMKPVIDKYREEFKQNGTYALRDFSYAIKAEKEANSKFGEQAIINRQIEILKSLNNTFKNKLVLLTFPFTDQKYKKIMTDFANSNPKTYFYDNLPNIQGPNMSSSQLPDGHPSVEGHRLIAANIFEYLKANKLISCQ